MALFSEWSDELEGALAEPFPRDVVQTKTLQGHAITFVAWHHYVRKLNHLVGGGWSMGAPIINDVAGKLVVGVPVTILGTSRINFGDEDDDTDSYGTAITNAYAQGLKRTLALFGMGLDMYEKKGVTRQVVERNLDTEPDHQQPQPTRQDVSCPKCGGAVWDNRAKKTNPKAPDFKCRDKACDGVIWPPKPKKQPVTSPFDAPEALDAFDYVDDGGPDRF